MNKNISEKLSKSKKSLLVALTVACAVSIPAAPAFANDLSPVTVANQTVTAQRTTSLGQQGYATAFAKNLDIRCDIEGNIIAQNASLNGVHVGLSNNVEGFKTSYVEHFTNTNWCSELLKSTNCTDRFIIGDDYKVVKDTRDNCWWIEDNGRRIFKSPLSHANQIVNIKDAVATKINFDSRLATLADLACNLKKQNTNSVDIILGNNYNRNGKLVCKEKLNVVYLTMNQYNAMYDFDIIMDNDATLVINLLNYTGQHLDNKVKINGQRNAYKGLAGKVLWNFGRYKETISFGETNQGVILAPNATVKIYSTHNGNVIANTVSNPGGEIHKNDFTGTFPVTCEVCY